MVPIKFLYTNNYISIPAKQTHIELTPSIYPSSSGKEPKKIEKEFKKLFYKM